VQQAECSGKNIQIYVNRKMRSVETTPGMMGGRIKG
jgi:hypothetical protein